MKKNVFITIAFLLFNSVSYTQIKTTIFPNGDAFKEFPMLNQISIVEIPIYEMPSFNLDSIIQEENYYREVRL